MPDIDRLIKAWEIFRDSNPYEICNGREFRAIREPEYCMGQMIEDTIALLKEQEPMTPEEFKDGLLKMFSSIWECEIDHPMFQDTVGELMNGVMQLYKKAVKWE